MWFFFFGLLPWMLHKDCCYMLNVLLLLLFVDSVDKCDNTLPSAYIYVCMCVSAGFYIYICILYSRLPNVLKFVPNQWPRCTKW